MTRVATLCGCLSLALAVGCSQGREDGGAAKKAPVAADVDVLFTDVTRAAGIAFEHNNGRSGRKWLPETLGSGCAFFDYNNDGRPDIFLVNSRPWEKGSQLSYISL